jgi:hypothetical protein
MMVVGQCLFAYNIYRTVTNRVMLPVRQPVAAPAPASE